MKRKFFTFLMAFLTTLSGAVWAHTSTNRFWYFDR